ncbi:MAG: hypothetical protein ACYCWW_05615, partial [Deltaproteobacteria bacterium]
MAVVLAQRGEVWPAAELIAATHVSTAAETAGRLERAGLLLRVVSPPRSAVLLRDALSLQPGAATARRALVEILFTARRFVAALQQCDAAPAGRDRIDSLVELGQRLIDEPLEHPLAKQAFELVRAADPGNALASQGLERLEAFKTSWSQMARQLRAAAVEERDRRTAADLYLRLASLYAAYDGQGAPIAHEQLQRCFLLWPGMPAALDMIEQLAVRWGDPGWAIRGYEALAGTARERSAAAELWERAAKIRLLQTGDRVAALQALEKAIEADPMRVSSVWAALELRLEEADWDGVGRLVERPLGRSAAGWTTSRIALAELLLSLGNQRAAATQLDALAERPPDSPRLLQAWLAAVERSGSSLLSERASSIAAMRADRADHRRAALVSQAERERAQGRDRLALRLFGEALWLYPDDEAILTSIQALVIDRDVVGELEQAFRRALQVASGGPEEGPLLRALARLLSKDAKSSSEAIALLRQILSTEPDDAEATTLLEEVLRREGRPEEMEAELRRRLSGTQSPDGRGRLLRELSSVLAGRAAPAAERIETLRELASLAPGDPLALRALADAEGELGDWTRVAQVLTHLGKLETDERRLGELNVERANVYWARLADPASALAALQAALGSAAGRAPALRLMEQLLGDPDVGGRVLDLLQAEYARSGEWSRVLAILARRVDASRSAPERAGTRIEQARIQEGRLADPRGAFSTLAAALPESPELVLPELVRVSRSLGMLHEAIDRAREVAASLGPAAGVPLARSVAVMAKELGDLERLAAIQAVILELSPSDPDALEALAVRAQQAGEAERAVELLRRQLLAGGPPSEQAPRLVAIGKNLLEVLGRPAEAADAFERALVQGAPELDVLELLAKARSEAGRAGEAAEALHRAVELVSADPSRTIRLRLRRAQVLADGIGDVKAAVAELQAVLALRPNDPAAILGLESLLGTEADRLAAEALVAAFEGQGDSARLAQALEALADRETAPDRRAGMLRRVAALQEQDLREPALAFSTLSRAIHLCPKDEELRRELHRLAAANQLDSELLATLEEIVQVQAGKAAVPLLIELGETHERLGDADAARRAFSQASRLHPANPAPYRELLRLARLAGDSTATAEAARALAELSTGDEKTALLAEAARQSPPARALDGWAKVLELAPGHGEAIAALEQLLAGPSPARESAAALLVPVYRQAKDKDRLAAALEPLAELGRTADERASTWIEIASLRDALGQARLALSARFAAVRNRPGDSDLLDEIEQGGQSIGALGEVADVYEALTRSAGAGEVAAKVLQRFAAFAAGPLGDPERALALEAHLSDITPAAPGPVERLVALNRRLGRERELAGSLVRLARFASDPARKKELLNEAAETFDGLADLDGAMAAYREILEVDPLDAAALERLGALLGTSGRWDELAAALATLVDQLLAAGSQLEADRLRLRLGLLRLERLGDLAGALPCFEALARGAVEDTQVVASLERALAATTESKARAAIAALLEPIYERAKNLSELVKVLQARADDAAEPEKGVLLQRVAALYATELRSPELAFLSASRALRENPQDLSSLEIALRSAEDAGAAEELAELLEEITVRAQAPEAVRRAHWALARLTQGPLANPTRAIAEWKRVLELAPDDAEAFRELSALLERVGEVSALQELLRRQLAVVEDVDRRRELLRRIGMLQEGPLRDEAGAYSTYRRLLELAPEDRAALGRLDALCLRQERWPELAPLLDQEARLAGQAGDRAGQAAFLLRLGQLRDGPLRDVMGAVEAFGAVLAIEPTRPEALAGLEGILQRDPSNLTAAELLEHVHAAAKDWPKVAAALDARAAATPDPQARRDILLQLARVRDEQQGRPDLAFIALCRAFRDEPQNAELRASLERMAEKAESYEELVGVYEEELGRSALPEILGPLSLEVGRLYDRKLNDPAAALVHYERARELQAAGGASDLQALERLYRTGE